MCRCIDLITYNGTLYGCCCIRSFHFSFVEEISSMCFFLLFRPRSLFWSGSFSFRHSLIRITFLGFFSVKYYYYNERHSLSSYKTAENYHWTDLVFFLLVVFMLVLIYFDVILSWLFISAHSLISDVKFWSMSGNGLNSQPTKFQRFQQKSNDKP